MNIFVTGGTGFVGRTLTGTFTGRGHRVTLLTRKIRASAEPPEGAVYLEGDPTRRGDWQARVPEHDAVVNLAGASIFTRWTASVKKKIRDSRVLTTQNIVDALSGRGEKRTRILLSTSAVGYYGTRGDEEVDESSPPGAGFLAEVTRKWEEEALRAAQAGVRVALLRFGVVLGREAGALQQLIKLFSWYLGSPLGTGRQWFSWIHEQDLAEIFVFVLENAELEGPLNCVAPNPVRNRELTRALAGVLGRPAFMPAVPGFVLRAVMGEFGSFLLEGQRVLPAVLSARGFTFRFPDIREALEDLIGD